MSRRNSTDHPTGTPAAISMLLVMVTFAVGIFGGCMYYREKNSFYILGISCVIHYLLYLSSWWRNTFSYSFAVAHAFTLLGLTFGDLLAQHINTRGGYVDPNFFLPSFFRDDNTLVYLLGQHFRAFLVANAILLLLTSCLVYYCLIRPDTELKRLIGHNAVRVIFNRMTVVVGSLWIFSAAFYVALYIHLKVSRNALFDYPVTAFSGDLFDKYTVITFAASAVAATLVLIRPSVRRPAYSTKCLNVILLVAVAAAHGFALYVIYAKQYALLKRNEPIHPSTGIPFLAAAGTMLILMIFELLTPTSTPGSSKSWESDMDPYSAPAEGVQNRKLGECRGESSSNMYP